MQIVTWNVNGIRANINKGSSSWLRENNSDIICLQEIKARAEQLNDEQRAVFNGLHEIWNPAQRPGYSGVATFTHQSPLEVITQLGKEEFDKEGRVIITKTNEFVLMNIYFPNGKRDLGRLKYKLDFYEKILGLCDQLHRKGNQVIICGDFNTAHQEIDLKNPKQNSKVSGFLPEERAWMDKYLAHGFVDAYRYLYPERVQYTWWTYRFNARKRNIGWRLDYFLVSAGLTDKIIDIVIHDDVLGSDHCPVSLFLDM